MREDIRSVPVPHAVLLYNRLIMIPVVAAAAAISALSVAAPAAAQTSSVHYVALGDSYASGVGAGDESGSCDQSPNAFSSLWTDANDPASYSFEACDGATTSGMISSQLSALSASTTLVSITIGGNDVGFVPTMVTCVVLPTSFCVKAVHASEAEISADLPGELDKVLSAISAHAPDARVVVLDYPHLYDLPKSASCAGLSTTDRTDLNQAADQLDAQIQAAASRHGDVFADVRGRFAGHEICDSPRWLNAVDWTDLGVSYHPTAAGQAGGYYQAFSASAG
jgi:lysophospholipase L1-like esterase